MNEKKGFGLKNFWLPLFIFAAVVIVFYKTLDSLPGIVAGIGAVLSVLSPFIMALIFSLLLYKPTNSLEQFFKKRKAPFVKNHALGLAVLLSYVGFILILTALLYVIIPKIISSITSLVSNVPYYYDTVLAYLKSVADENGKVLGVEVAKMKDYISLDTVLSYFSLERLTGYLSGITKATGFALHLSLAFVASIYMLLGRKQLVKTAGRLLALFIPHGRVTRLHGYLSRSCAIFCNYLYSQCLDAMLMALLSFTVLSIARIPYALLLAVVIGLCNLIPYFGALISGVLVVGGTLISTGNFVQTLIALACVIGLQQLDANFMQPRVVSQSVGLKPLYVLFAITVGNGLFGLPGVLLGVPAFAVIRMLVVDYMNSLNGEDTPLVKRQLAARGEPEQGAEPAQKNNEQREC